MVTSTVKLLYQQTNKPGSERPNRELRGEKSFVSTGTCSSKWLAMQILQISGTSQAILNQSGSFHPPIQIETDLFSAV